MANQASAGLPKLSRRGRILLITGGAVILALILGAQGLDAYVRWLWFGSVGFRGVFTTVVLTKVALFFSTGLLVGGALAISLLIAYRTRPVFVPVSGTDDPLARYRSAITARARWFGIGIPTVVGLVAGTASLGDWKRVQMFFNATQFGRTDPVFGLDIGFYVFKLPFYNWLLTWIFAALIVSFIGGLLAHYLFGGIRLAGRSGQVSVPARAHLLIIVGVFVLVKAVDYFFDRYNLLLSDRNSNFTGATYTDLHAVMPAKLILLCISVICAIAFFAGAFMRNVQLPAITLVLLILSGILVGWAWPTVLQQFSVQPNEASKEATSIKRNMVATRHAYGIADIKYKTYPGQTTATPEEVRSNKATISNIRLLDPRLLSDTFTQRLGVRNVYGFPEELDVDRYKVDGELQPFIVSVKQLDTSALTGNQTSWVNKHMVYTHGNGFVAAPADKINRAVEGTESAGGYPLLGISNLDNPRGAHGIYVEQPRVYFSRMLDTYSIVGGQKATAPGEYDGPGQPDYLYKGTGGVPIDSWINRLVFAAKFGEQRILFTDAIGEGSRIMFVRDPLDRVRKVAPWLTLDGDPYPAVINGRIKWIIDGYTTSNMYPYSQRIQFDTTTQDSGPGAGRLSGETINYIRNSVKITVDAFSGKVTLYAANPNDPVLQAWMNVFPDLIKPASAISPELRQHFRYPVDLFNVQRKIISKYHVDTPGQYYTGGLFWDVPKDPTESNVAPGDESRKQPPYYMLAQMPGDKQPTFQLTSVLTPQGRDTLAAYVSVSSAPETYGQITVLKLPAQKKNEVEGPVQVQNRFQSDPEYTQVRRSLKAPNVEIINGNLLTLPVAKGFMYVEPVYIQQKGENSYPQLARVLVSYGADVGVAPTLGAALDELFGEGAGKAAEGPESPEDVGTNPPPSANKPPSDSPDTSTPSPPPSTDNAPPKVQEAINNALKQVEEAREALQNALERLQQARNSGAPSGG